MSGMELFPSAVQFRILMQRKEENSEEEEE
jgi:hypothetical protein